MVCRPSHPGNILVSLSMNNLELTVLAHLSKDEAITQCLTAHDPVAQVANHLSQVLCFTTPQSQKFLPDGRAKCRGVM